MTGSNAGVPGGVLAPLVTPFTAEGDLDGDALGSLVGDLVGRGIDGVVPCGTTGEFASLSAAEHRQVIETTVAATDGDVPVIAGTAGTNLEAVFDRLDAAAAAGADATLVPPQYYHSAPTAAGNERFLTRVADASPLPVYLYNIPSSVGQEASVDTVAALARHDNVAGLKDSSGDFTYFVSVYDATPDSFTLFQGFDSLSPASLATYGCGAINACANTFPEPFAEMKTAILEGDTQHGRELHAERILPLFRLGLEYGFAPVIKEALAKQGRLPTATTRLPYTPLDGEATSAIESILA